ncbi:threonine synthase [Aggregatibacter actinomycetemcomitans]|uniref:threonine synthase n=1 Tax=Aggregatibacter actinomycetemcomitans TaxID=714 RepID=UPI00022AC978|nr:threonine synthase [Aggregatibacter actinomycetemcomitans]AEW77777.1 threonine synthase [Aggregatibacter actinomycetemcomitans ANH9381]AHN72501.1 threonine synthase, putative [Aggregatibacter actinomycetemcomitans HK1651]AMQ91872.1 threonine synthase [Aggregatibacter actinomycetemcomitans]KND82962.1 threonine synthase [Aggregatibacter actinomycetemcomitans serotype b str. SCC1398]KOE52518.1 threonine synthase [Aggregatibacter actinomycetemcomitans serotype b str. I23C]
MNLYNIKHPEEQVNFAQAVRQGLGKDQGLFFPQNIPHLTNIDELLALPLIERSQKILGALIGEEIPPAQLEQVVRNAFTFPAPVVKVEDNIYALELFHGPTLAFKDFGGRFMAQALATVRGDGKITILTATSGDTGAAVAHAFYGLDNIEVVILYPKGKISPLQEKLFCTLGGNIRTVAINADFDACQALVKQAFDDAELRQAIGLNSANSINISRLLAQVCYYFEAAAQLPKKQRENLVVSVPSGNFGNLTAGLIAKTLGLPIKRFIAATNANDTVPRYLHSGNWSPNATVATLSNAMDVSRPNNWPRVEELFKRNGWTLTELHSAAISDGQTEETLRAMHKLGYLCEPHGAVAYEVLKQDLQTGETGLFLCTAHPAKFKESVERILDLTLPLPEALDKHNKLPLLSDEMENDFAQLRAYLLK